MTDAIHCLGHGNGNGFDARAQGRNSTAAKEQRIWERQQQRQQRQQRQRQQQQQRLQRRTARPQNSTAAERLLQLR
jgi:hypothetical protein